MIKTTDYLSTCGAVQFFSGTTTGIDIVSMSIGTFVPLSTHHSHHGTGAVLGHSRQEDVADLLRMLHDRMESSESRLCRRRQDNTDDVKEDTLQDDLRTRDGVAVDDLELLPFFVATETVECKSGAEISQSRIDFPEGLGRKDLEKVLDEIVVDLSGVDHRDLLEHSERKEGKELATSSGINATLLHKLSPSRLITLGDLADGIADDLVGLETRTDIATEKMLDAQEPCHKGRFDPAHNPRMETAEFRVVQELMDKVDSTFLGELLHEKDSQAFCVIRREETSNKGREGLVDSWYFARDLVAENCQHKSCLSEGDQVIKFLGISSSLLQRKDQRDLVEGDLESGVFRSIET